MYGRPSSVVWIKYRILDWMNCRIVLLRYETVASQSAVLSVWSTVTTSEITTAMLHPACRWASVLVGSFLAISHIHLNGASPLFCKIVIVSGPEQAGSASAGPIIIAPAIKAGAGRLVA